MFSTTRMNSFLSSVKETMDTANNTVNAKLNDGIKAAMENEKVKSATTYIQQNIPIPGTNKNADGNNNDGGKPPASSGPALLDLDSEEHGNVEVEDWSSPSSAIVTSSSSTITPQPPSSSTDLVPVAAVSSPDQAHSSDGGSIQSSNTVECGDCKTLITINALLDKFNPNKSYHHCRMCSKVFCLSCIAKSPLPVPFDLLHQTYQGNYLEVVSDNKNWFTKLAASTTSTISGLSGGGKDLSAPSDAAATNTTVTTTDLTISSGAQSGAGATAPPAATTVNTYKEDRQYVCNKECLCRLQTVCMENFRNEMMDKFGANVTTYIAKPYAYKIHQQFFPIPSGIMEDNPYRRALRFAHIADAVGSYTGLSVYIKAAKYLYLGSEFVNMIIGSELYPVLEPMLENLKTYGITGPTALLCIYYLGCQHTMRYKDNQNSMRQSILYHPQDVPGVLASECPLHVLEYISRFVSPAQWLYTAVLPAPHDNNDWSSWYLGNMIKHQGWSLLMNINDTTKLPDGKKCPAFAIVARTRRDPVTKAVIAKEAMLVIRGSHSSMDWSINFDEELMEMQFSYRPVITTPTLLQNVMGYAHKGIYNGARGILDGYGARVFLMLLFNSGYNIQMVGHSLGAGVAALIAADLRSTIVQSQDKDRQLNADAAISSHHAANLSLSYADVDRKKALEAHRISAVVFSCPAVVTENLAVAFVEDRLLINVVNGPDAIPRFSRFTMKALAKEMDCFKGQAEIWTLQDKKDITSYIKKMGKASDIHHSTSQERTIARYMKLFQKKNDGSALSDDEDEPMSGQSDHSNLTATSSNALTTTANAVNSFGSQIHAEAEKGRKQIEQTFRTIIRRASVSGDGATASTTVEGTTSTEVVVSQPTPTVNEQEASSNSVFSGIASKNAALWSAMTNFASSNAASVPPTSATPVADEVEVVSVPPSAPPAVPAKPRKPLPSTPSTPSAPPLIDLTVSPVNEPSAPPAFTAADNSSVQLIDIKGDNTNESTRASSDDDKRTVTPGPIIHLYKESDGAMKAAVITHQHPTFQHIQLLLVQLLEDHAMKTYRQSFDSVLFHARKAHRKGSSSLSTAHNIDNLFPMHVTNSMSAPVSAGDNTAVVLNDSFGENADDDDDDEDPMHDVALVTSKKGEKEDRSVNASSNVDGNSEHVDLGSIKVEHAHAPGYICAWTPCSICQLDVTWPYIMHSDASRGLVKNYCASCNRVVCNFCAPAGDELPGDGLNQTVRLADYRMSLPWKGVYTSQRVCIHCYFNSTYPGLEDDH